MVKAPHESANPLTRHGSFWLTGRLEAGPTGSVQYGQAYVEWIAPPTVTRSHPVVLVHGGGGQGTDWLTTPDGRPGWAYRFADAGYAVYVIDRPGHGRSPYNPELLGGHLGQTSSEIASFLFASPDSAELQTQWPWGRKPGDPELEQVAASSAFLLADAAQSQELDGLRLAELLERIGPAIVVTHSAGAPAGWLALDRASESIVALVAIEPMGPPFLDMPGIPPLVWGLTTAPIRTVPATSEPAELTAGGHLIAGFDGARILLVAGDASPRGLGTLPLVADFLAASGAVVEALPLGERGIRGNGHGLIFEANSDETIAPVLEWIEGIG